MFGQRKTKTHGQLMREELSEGFGHLRQAAGHAAGGVGGTLPARLGVVMAALTPSVLAARTRAASRRRTTILVGLLAAGVAAGAAGAMMARRRNQAKWDEYEQRGIQAAREDAESVLDPAKSTMDEGADPASEKV